LIKQRINKKIAKDIVSYLYIQNGSYSNQYQLTNALIHIGYSTDAIHQTIIDMKKNNLLDSWTEESSVPALPATVYYRVTDKSNLLLENQVKRKIIKISYHPLMAIFFGWCLGMLTPYAYKFLGYILRH